MTNYQFIPLSSSFLVLAFLFVALSLKPILFIYFIRWNIIYSHFIPLVIPFQLRLTFIESKQILQDS